MQRLHTYQLRMMRQTSSRSELKWNMQMEYVEYVLKLAAFRRGWVSLSQDFRGRGRPPTNLLIPLERQLIALQLSADSFYIGPNETLQQTSRPLLSKLV